MGQKVNPISFRIGINKNWSSLWYAEKDYGKYLYQDFQIRSFIEKKFANAGISSVDIERSNKRIKVVIHTARPGAVIGKSGESIEQIRKYISGLNANVEMEIGIDLVEIKRPELDAKLVALSVAEQLEKRFPFKRAMKKAITQARKLGADGIKVMVAGRLGGAEIARTEWLIEGSMPLHTLRADIDYGVSEAHTTYGVIGVKVWIYNKKR